MTFENKNKGVPRNCRDSSEVDSFFKVLVSSKELPNDFYYKNGDINTEKYEQENLVIRSVKAMNKNFGQLFQNKLKESRGEKIDKPVNYDNPEYEYFIKFNRTSKNEINELINIQSQKYVNSHPSNTLHAFKRGKLDHIAELEQLFCENWERLENKRKRGMYHALNLYKQVLDERIPNELITDVTASPSDIGEELTNTDNRRSDRIKNDVRLKALIDILPEFVRQVDKMANKEEKGKLLELITGVNPNDAYKKVCTSAPLKITTEEQARIDRFRSMIEQAHHKEADI
jgi:hypothetical protein